MYQYTKEGLQLNSSRGAQENKLIVKDLESEHQTVYNYLQILAIAVLVIILSIGEASLLKKNFRSQTDKLFSLYVTDFTDDTARGELLGPCRN